MLPETNLLLYSNKAAYRQVQYSSNTYMREKDEYDSVLLNGRWKVKPSVIIDNGRLKVLTCKWHDGGRDKLTLFAPRSPHGHTFYARLSDQLSPCIRKHRVARQMKASKYNTKFAMYRQFSSYEGVCTMDLTTHGNFGSGSELLSQHEAASIVGRNDINLLLNKKS